MNKLLQLILAIACLIFIVSSAEQYRVAVAKDTNHYLACRQWYYEHPQTDDADAYSQRMCDNRWSWWNYEVFTKKFFSRY